MAGVKISNLPAIAAPAATDVFPVVQAGVTYKETITQLGTLVLLLSGGTMTGPLILSTSSPSTALEAASKGYVDSVAVGLEVQPSCVAASTGALTVTYSNGASGVGATLTNAGALAAFSLDGVSPTVGQRVLIKNQASTFENGIYTVTTVGSGAANWVLTRATDYDTAAEINVGDLVTIDSGGTTNGLSSWLQTATVATVGTDAISFSQFTASPALFLRIANNLSDVASAPTAYNNLFQTTEVTGVSENMTVNRKYIANNAGLVTLTLPATAAVGDELVIMGKGAGGWLVAQNASGQIQVGSSATTVGVGGSIASTNQWDSVRLVCVTANNIWAVAGGPQSAGLTIV